MRIRSEAVTAIAAAVLVALPLLTNAQAWPTRGPVKIVVPFPPGGNTDGIARITGEWLARAFNQQFVVENRAGAFGTIAAESVAKAPADGYTLFMTAHAQVVTVPLMLTKRTYDPQKDFAPVSIVGTNGFVLGVHASVPASTLREFVTHARTGKVNYASGGSGSMSHLSGALFARRAGLDMQHVPFKGGGPAAQNLIAGQVHMYFGNYSELIPHAETGRVRLLAVSGEKRAPQLPNVPTVAESGFPGFRTVTFNGLVAPAGTPPEIVDRVAAEVRRMVADPGASQKLIANGIELTGTTPKEFADIIASELAVWSDIVRETGIRLD